MQLGELQKRLADFTALDTQILAIAPDKTPGLAKMTADLSLGFPVLFDDESKTIDAYGIRNPSYPALPHPTVVLVDKQGVVRFVHLDEDYRRRPPPDDLLAAVRALGESDAKPGG